MRQWRCRCRWSVPSQRRRRLTIRGRAAEGMHARAGRAAAEVAEHPVGRRGRVRRLGRCSGCQWACLCGAGGGQTTLLALGRSPASLASFSQGASTACWQRSAHMQERRRRRRADCPMHLAGHHSRSSAARLPTWQGMQGMLTCWRSGGAGGRTGPCTSPGSRPCGPRSWPGEAKSEEPRGWRMHDAGTRHGEC